MNIIKSVCIAGCDIDVELEVAASIYRCSMLSLASFLWNYT
jgi:hypothetical protein